MSNMHSVAPQFLYSVQDVATNGPTDVVDGKTILRGIMVNTAIATAGCVIKDGTTAVFTLPSGTAAGWIPCGDAFFLTKLVIDPDDSATGNVTLVYAPVDVA